MFAKLNEGEKVIKIHNTLLQMKLADFKTVTFLKHPFRNSKEENKAQQLEINS